MGKIKKEKTSKNSHEKKSRGEASKKRKNGEKKKTSVEEGTRKYGYISANSVITMAEAAGFSGIQEEVAKSLAEDVTYRLRYIIQQCKKYMTHSRHKKLTCSDINEVFKMCDVPAVYGYNVDSALHNFIYVKEADVFVLEDNVIDLPAYALTEIVVDQRPSILTTGSWLKPEDHKPKTENKSRNDDARASNGEPQTSDNFKSLNSVSTNYENQKSSSENGENETKIPTNLIKYYGITCNTILGHSDLKLVFQDLSTSSRILPIIPYLLNFITMTLNKLTSERQIKRLLQSVEALSRNLKIDFSPYLATTRVINAMLLIVAVDKMNYDYHLRAYAARVLSIVLARWCTRDEQRIIVINKMGKLLGNLKASAKVHYGAIVLLTSLGPEALNISFWGMVDKYLMYLQKMKQDWDQKSPKDVAMLEQVVLLAVALLYRHPFPHKVGEKFTVAELDRYLYSYFGDSLCNLRLNLLENPRFVALIRKYSGSEPDQEKQSDIYCKTTRYISTWYRPETVEITLGDVFTLPKTRRKRNPRIMFKFAGAIPVPDKNLKRKRLDSRHSQCIVDYEAVKESRRHVIAIGKFNKYCHTRSYKSVHLPVGCIYSIL